MRVLILDDDAAICRLATRIAVAAGCDAASATAGPQFRSLYDAELPDLIILDLRIGATDGVEELRFLSNRAYPNALALVSGFDQRVLATAEALAQGLGLKVIGTLAKPFHPPALTHLLDMVKAQAGSAAADQLHAALAKNQLALDYQPIATRRDGAIRGLEALLRWNHPTAGRLLPDRFIASVEAVPKVMNAVTDWTIAAAIRQYGALRKLGMTTPIAVNISGRALYDGDFPDRLAARLLEAKIAPAHLCLEISESAVARDPARTMETLSRLRLKGIELAIDEFGASAWPLSHFRQLPFSTIKIAAAFIRAMPTSAEALKAVKSALELAQEWGLATIAEGVDSEECAAQLVTLGIGAVQGSVIAAPLAEADLAPWLRRWRERASPAPVRSNA